MLANLFLISALEFTSDKVTLDYPQQQRSKQSKQQAFTSSTSTLDYQQKEQIAW